MINGFEAEISMNYDINIFSQKYAYVEPLHSIISIE